MKKLNFLILFSSFLLFTGFVQAQHSDVKLKWDYPVKPGSKGWSLLKNVKERVDACQIDASVLRSLSNEDLVHIVLEHPFFKSFVAYDSPKAGINSVIGGFNGYNELISRENAMNDLSKIYFAEDFNQLASIEDTVERAEYTLKWIGVELMMSNEKLLNQLSESEKIDFLKSLYEKYLIKKLYREDFGGIAKMTTAYLSNEIFKSLNYSPLKDVSKRQDIELFEKRMVVKDGLIIDDIIDNLADFVDKK